MSWFWSIPIEYQDSRYCCKHANTAANYCEGYGRSVTRCTGSCLKMIQIPWRDLSHSRLILTFSSFRSPKYNFSSMAVSGSQHVSIFWIIIVSFKKDCYIFVWILSIRMLQQRCHIATETMVCFVCKFDKYAVSSRVRRHESRNIVNFPVYDHNFFAFSHVTHVFPPLCKKVS